MVSMLLRCLLKHCFDSDSEESNESYLPPRSQRMIRFFNSNATDSVSPPHSQHVATRADDQPEEEVGGNSDNCCSGDDSATAGSGSIMSSANTTTSGFSNNPHAVSLRQFWRNFRERLNLDMADVSNTALSPTSKQQRDERIPILKQASSFDSSKGVPTIQTEQIVLPGSILQQEMAKAMAAQLEDHEDECVICMESFSPSNPRMPTLCGCGENKAVFHLPCLYQWIEQSKNCPSCRKKLRWEEF